MNNNIVVSENSQNGELTTEAVQTLILAGIVPKDTPKSQIQIFAHVCREKGVSPFSKEIYLVAYGNKYSIITGIDGFRKIASRTGELCGCDDAKYDLKSNGDYKTVADFQKNELPNTCTITIYRLMNGVRCPFTHTAKFSEFSSGQQKWLSMPFQMIAKVAEAFAIRKGFGDATSGISIEDETAAIQDIQAPVKPALPELSPTTDAKKWEKAVIEYCTENVTLQQIQKKYYVSPENIEILNAAKNEYKAD